MAAKERCIIVGANLTGGKAAETLRKEGFEGIVTLIGAEPHRPYDRPPLSKEYLRGEKGKEKLYFKPEEFYKEQEIELCLGVQATSLDTKQQALTLSDGDSLKYDKLLIATGSRVRKLNISGSDLEGVYYLRAIEDSDKIAEAISKGGNVVVVGAGFIGSEVAASCKAKGLDVTVLELTDVPLKHALGDELGRVYAEIHREQGVDLRLKEGIEEFRGNKKLGEVITSNGGAIPCDFAVVGVGIAPDTSLVEGADIKVDNGIVVDEYCQTSASNVFAAGDVANWPHPDLGYRLRVEHWDNAQNQGATAAKNMLGQKEPYSPVLYFWSDQYQHNMQYLGHAREWDKILYRGSVEERKFTAFYLKEGLVKAAFVLNDFRSVSPARRLIGQRLKVDEKHLSDPEVNLKKLVAEATE